MLGGNLIRVDGVRELLQQFAKLDKSVQRQYLGAAVTATVKPHIPEVRAFTPKGPTGNMKRSVGAKTEKKRRKVGSTATAILGYRSGGKNKQHLGYHAWWIDQGVKARTPKQAAALFIPGRRASKVPYLRGMLDEGVEGTSKTGLFFRRVKGFAGTGRYAAWARANLPKLRADLIRNLQSALAKAEAQHARRQALKAQGRSTR